MRWRARSIQEREARLLMIERRQMFDASAARMMRNMMVRVLQVNKMITRYYADRRQSATAS